MKKLYLISNDKIWFSRFKYTSNNDLNNIISSLNRSFSIKLLCRKSKKKTSYKLNQKIDLLNIKQIKEKKINVLMISISPYNFFIFFLLYLKNLNFNGFVYLRSDGFMEYRIKYGILGYYFYFFMFFFIKKKLKIISCSKNFNKVKTKRIVHPSELNNEWIKRKKNREIITTDLLYVGRFKKEKGAFFISKIFKEYLKEYKLTLVGTEKKMISKEFYSKNIKIFGPIIEIKKLIKIYDSTKIFILPSYTEGFPKVILESLSRLKPVIIFKEIKHVMKGRKGIFVCDRNEISLQNKIKYINKNYHKIQKTMLKNFFFTKKNFENELLKILNNEF